MITVSDILNNKKKRDARRHEVFDLLLERCCKKISAADAIRQMYCIFDVPDFVFGYPLYNLNECMGYLLQELTKRGFQVQYMFPRTLIISWFVVMAKTKEKKQRTVAASKKGKLTLTL